MNKHILLIIFSCQIISGCGLVKEAEPSEAEPSESSLPEELARALNAELIMPEGRLRNVVVYGGNSEQVDTYLDIYYPADGNKDYRVIRNLNMDTVSVTVFLLQPSDNNNILKSMSYSYESGPPTWTYTREYEYDSENRLASIYYVSPTRERFLLARYLYNHKGLLKQIEYPFQSDAEAEGFQYDEENRIISSTKFVTSDPGFIMEKFYYRYKNTLLEAKETGQFASDSEERRDAFQYFYDSTGRMILQKEFDPYFGFQQVSKTEYFYH